MKAPPEEKRRRSVLRHKSRCPRTKKRPQCWERPPDEVRAEDDVRDKAVAGMPSMTMRLPAGRRISVRPRRARLRAPHVTPPQVSCVPGRQRIIPEPPPARPRRQNTVRQVRTQKSREKKIIFILSPFPLCRVMWLGCVPTGKRAGRPFRHPVPIRTDCPPYQGGPAHLSRRV